MLQNVLKLGGSLLDLEGLEHRVQDLVAQLNLAPCLIVTGGGDAAEWVRERQQIEHFDDEEAHWRAIAAMSENARRLFEQHPGYLLVANRDELAAALEHSNNIAVMDAEPFIRSEERELPPVAQRLSPLTRLRPAWDVTSDSIAVWLALRLGATSVHLLKSCDPTSLSLPELSKSGAVDQALTELPVPENYLHWINLRRPDTLRFKANPINPSRGAGGVGAAGGGHENP